MPARRRASDVEAPRTTRMGPARRSRPRGRSGLPRARGDGPDYVAGFGMGAWASPAHVGMAPRARGDGPDIKALRRQVIEAPRTRGDGPAARRRDEETRLAPPHARGWPLAGAEAVERVTGSPTHAGVALSAASARSTRPRPSPHTRGWTHRQAGGDRHQGGSPAHAVMGPLTALGMKSASMRPRTRGDGPSPRRRPNIAMSAPRTRGG